MAAPIQLYLAPFQGITGYVFREVYAQHFGGLDKLYTPFFTGIHKQKSLDAKKKELLQTHQMGIQLVPQILSKDADEIIRFNHYCRQLGFSEVNWNLGCPYPRVANKKRGSGMLPYPDMVSRILEKVMTENRIGFSVKCRLGYHSPAEIDALIPVFNHYNVAELTIHARIGRQLYQGDVNLGQFEKALEMAEMPVVYNGDIFSIEDFNYVSGRFRQVSRWMIGRGLLADPYLPSLIKGVALPPPGETGIGINRFVTDLYLAYRKSKNDNLHTIGVMKELWSHLANGFEQPQKVFNTIKKTKTFDAYEEAVKTVFDNFGWLGSGGLKLNKTA